MYKCLCSAASRSLGHVGSSNETRSTIASSASCTSVFAALRVDHRDTSAPATRALPVVNRVQMSLQRWIRALSRPPCVGAGSNLLLLLEQPLALQACGGFVCNYCVCWACCCASACWPTACCCVNHVIYLSNYRVLLSSPLRTPNAVRP